MTKTAVAERQWANSSAMAEELGISVRTLYRLKNERTLNENHHYRRANPANPRSKLVWHRQRTSKQLAAA